MSTLIAPWSRSADLLEKMSGTDMSDLLSERSRRFYDGTYKWNSDGFIDDQGVHRKFSDEPFACPPTPFPPMPWSDVGDDSYVEHQNSRPVLPKNTSDISETGHGVLDHYNPSGPPATDELAISPGSDTASSISDYPSDLSDREQVTDPGPRQSGDIRQVAIGDAPGNGRREAASTPVNAPSSSLSRPVGPSALRATINALKKEQDDEDDEDDDEKKRKNNTAKNNHEESKTKKRKKDDDDDEDDADKEPDSAAGGKEEITSAEHQGRKDSKATSTGKQCRKANTTAANQASNVANVNTEEPQTPTDAKDAHPAVKTPSKKGKHRPHKRAPKTAVGQPMERHLTARQFALESKKKAADLSTANGSNNLLGKRTRTVKMGRA